MYEHRIQEAKAGRPRSGKTYQTEAQAKAYAGLGRGPVFIYNKGRRTDFSSALMIKPLTFAEHRRFVLTEKEDWSDFSAAKELLYFWGHDGNIYHFRDFVRLYWGKIVAMKRIPSMDKYVFGAVHKYLCSTMFIIDDVAGILRHGTSDQLSTLLSSYHSGDYANVPEKLIGTGVDIVMMFHGIDRINPEIWKYVTHATLFPTIEPPEKGFTRNKELEREILKGWNEVQLLPKHSAISYFVDSYPIQKSIIQPESARAIHNKFKHV